MLRTLTVLLGTVALEPNRWGAITPDRRPTIDLADWLDDIADAGFDGIELWDGHASEAVLDHPIPVPVFNSYASLDDDAPEQRHAAAKQAAAAASTGLKFNVGTDATAVGMYAQRIAAWLDGLPPSVRLLCECHSGTIAEQPAVATAILDAAGPPARVGAIVHTHESTDHLRARFDAYGDRIVHVHVNFLEGGHAPPLADRLDELALKVELMRDLGFSGTWTIEFVHGVLTERDAPSHLIPQAARDLAVLNGVLG
jgi:sugar phosphate isomerase/epimerase